MYLNILIFLLVVTIILCIAKNMEKTLLFVFSILWLLVVFLYRLRLFGIYEIGDRTELVLLIGIGCFIIGYVLANHIGVDLNRKSTSYNHEIYCDTNVNFPFVNLVFGVIVILGALYYIPNIITGIRAGGFSLIKGLIMNGEVSTGGPVVQYIVRPFQKIMVAASAYCIFNQKKQKFIIFSGFIMIAYEFFGMYSKSSLIYMGLCLLGTFFIHSRITDNIKSDKRIIIIVGLGIAIFLASIIGSQRLYFYLCGCIPMLDKIVDGNFYTSEGLTYGFLSFHSLLRPFVKLLSPLFGSSRLFDISENYYFRFETTTRVSNIAYYNAFHTMFGDFYVDGGFIGVVAFSLFFGIICASIQKKYNRSNSLYSHIIYCIVLYYAIFSIVRFQMSNTVWGLALIYAVVIMPIILYQKFSFGRIKFYEQ